MSAVSAPPRRLIVAITGATGAIYGVRLLDAMRRIDALETHVVVSSAGWLNLQHELGLTKDDLHPMADVVHSVRNVGASIASGSFATDGMIVAPCSMKTLASIAHGLSDNLIARAADVTLKERRRLVLLVRETPLNLAHLRNMTAVTEMGGVIFPPLPAFYHRPTSIDDIVNDTVARVLDMFALGPALAAAWPGLRGEA
ncbi:UbiX family flavin prenyltransferase [Trinickia soli]|uniref:Flavin prenyltransferase UbiX n=1 Tax=Trinickia soli TaxID=380675 RepID=A0A2N7VYP2_9BURK|nr:UbiX family flavin prenyltransferase [Trinickia soli]KAA0088095.1 UbiX family flavin prenyltransferase [Paraburkholderia sp. T12-10]PMS22260.1 3-octaprenyl-4-hydroxybenzoate carboxy-lyase [Trinickia soli]CAB3706089.1 Flavin prenyltransferase UbiX [Trinickia soli]